MAGFAVAGASAPLFEDDRSYQADPQPLSFGASIGAAFDDQTETRNLNVRAEALRAALWDRQIQAEKATGQKLTPSLGMLGGTPDISSAYAQALTPALGDDEYEAQFDKLRQAQPQQMAAIKTRAQLVQDLDTRLNTVRARAGQASAEHPVAAFLGGATGGLLDPVNLGAMVVGGGVGAGRPLVVRALQMGLTNAVAEGAEIPNRMIDAQVAGPAYTAPEAAGDVASAFGSGVLMDLGAHALGAVARPLLRRIGVAAVDPATRGAAQALDQAARDDQALGPIDGLTHEEGLDALATLQPKPEPAPARDLGDLFADAPKTAPGSSGPFSGPSAAADYMGRTIWQGSFDPKALETDPVRFQYKADADAAGVTRRLQGVQAWDPTASGKVVVFEDRAGRQFVADGHQRLGLARRLDAAGFEPKLDGYLFREADGWTARQVRTIAALKNIREGSGTILDAAKIFRDAPEAIRDPSLPVTGDFITQAKALARLDPEAFGAVVNKVVPERYAAEIGAMAGDRPDLHAGLVKLLREGEPASLDEARALISEAKLDDWIKTEGEQTDMFGGLAPESTTIARAKVKAAVLNALKKDARIYGQLVRHADAIEAGGNVLLRDQNEAAAVVNRTALEVLNRLSLRSGEVGDAMARAAREVAEGKRPADAARGITQMVRGRIAAGEQLEGLRLAAIDPKPPSAAGLDLAAKLDDFRSAEAQALAHEAPEDAGIAEGLFDEHERRAFSTDGEEAAAKRLRDCIPGE